MRPSPQECINDAAALWTSKHAAAITEHAVKYLTEQGYVIVDAHDIDNAFVRLGGSLADSRGRLIMAAREVIAQCPHRNTYTSVDGLRERCYRCDVVVAEHNPAPAVAE